MPTANKPSIHELLESAPLVPLEEHLNHIRLRVDLSITKAHQLRERYCDELLTDQPHLANQIRKPGAAALNAAEQAFKTGTIAAVDGTISPVPLLAGSKIQIGGRDRDKSRRRRRFGDTSFRNGNYRRYRHRY